VGDITGDNGGMTKGQRGRRKNNMHREKTKSGAGALLRGLGGSLNFQKVAMGGLDPVGN